MSDLIKKTTKRKMHTIPLYDNDRLHRYLETHSGFRSKTELMAAAFEHFRDCRLARFRDVTEAQTGPAMLRADAYVESLLSIDPFDFADLLDHLAIAARTAIKHSHWDLLVQIATRMDVELHSLPSEHDEHGNPIGRTPKRVGKKIA